MFTGLSIYIDKLAEPQETDIDGGSLSTLNPADLRLQIASNTAKFAGARPAGELDDQKVTHVVVGDDRSRLRNIRDSLQWRVFSKVLSLLDSPTGS